MTKIINMTLFCAVSTIKTLRFLGLNCGLTAITIVFTALPCAYAASTNICLNDDVTVTVPYGREESGLSAHNIIDGDYSTQWGSGSSSTVWAIVDLAQEYALDSINIVGVNTGVSSWHNYTVFYDLLVSLDYDSWSLVGSGVLYDNPDWDLRSDSFSLNDVQARYVKFQSTGGQHWPGFNELEVFSNPVPLPSTLWLLGSCIFSLIGVRRLFYS